MTESTAATEKPVTPASSPGGDTAGAVSELLAPLTAYLDDIAARAAERLGPVAGVAITMGVKGIPVTIGASTPLARDVDALQYDIGTGPCLYALEHGVGMYVPDLAADDRWGAYGPKAAELGARSCISVPVLYQDTPAAVFKAYADVVDGLTAEQQAIARSTAPEISGGIGLIIHLGQQAQAIDDRTAAMSSRRVIDMAIGILMQRLHIDSDSAFALLRKLSSTRNIKLRTVAASIVSELSTSSTATSAPFADRARPADR